MKDAVSDWEHVSNMLKHLGQAPCKATQRLQGQLNKPPPSSAPSTAPRELFAVTTLCAGVWLEVLKHLRQTGLWFALGQISNYVGLQRVIIRWPRPLMRWRDIGSYKRKNTMTNVAPISINGCAWAMPFSDSHDRAESDGLVPFGIKLNKTGLHSNTFNTSISGCFKAWPSMTSRIRWSFSSIHETGLDG